MQIFAFQIFIIGGGQQAFEGSLGPAVYEVRAEVA
jgi:hypothetical protein